MRTRQIEKWDVAHPRQDRLRKTCATHNETSFYMALAPKLNNEELCNLIITLIHQTISMISKLIELVKEDFLRNGGIKEQMHRARINARSNR